MEIFHGGCLSCVVQDEEGIDVCTGCQYCEANWDLPDLSRKSKEEIRKENKTKRLIRKAKRINRFFNFQRRLFGIK